MALLYDTGLFSVINADSSVGVGWKLNFYTSGTTTRKATYPTQADALAGTNPNANPVVADANGRFGAIWLVDTSYKAVLTNAANVVKVTRDPCVSGSSSAASGYVTPEQFGAIGDGATNDLPEWQAMYTYAKGAGIKAAISNSATTYAWRAPTLSLANSYDAFDVAGPCNFLTISHDFALDGQGARVNLYGHNGGDLQTETQAITGHATWRGNGVNVIGGTSGTASLGIKRVAIKDLKIDGGWTRVTGASSAAELAYSDVYHKGFRIQDTDVDELYFDNVEFTGFGGEVWYFGNYTNATKITLVNCRGGNSNQAALNPSRGNLTVIGGEFGNAPIAIESLGGTGQRFIGTRFYNAWQCSFYGAAQFNGSGAVSFTQPTNTGSEAEPPFIDFQDVLFDNCGQITAANYMRGKITLLDTSLTLSSIVAGECHDVYLEIECITHKKNNGAFLVLSGPATTTTAYGGGYIKLPRNINIKITERRTKYAIDNSIQTTALIDIQGLVDQASCVIDVGACETGKIAGSSSGLAMPLIRQGLPVGVATGSGVPLGATTTTTTGSGTSYALSITSPRHDLINGGAAGIVTMSIAAPFSAPGGYSFGQRCRIGWNGNSPAGTVFYFAKNATRLSLQQDRRLTTAYDWLEVEWNDYTAKWHEVGSYSAVNSADIVDGSEGLGYGTGSGGAVTQATNKSTGVTLDKTNGAITLNNAALAAATSVGFTLTNAKIAATDVVLASIKSGATADSYTVTVDAVAAGSCRISLRNISAGSLSEAVVISFAVIKAVNA